MKNTTPAETLFIILGLVNDCQKSPMTTYPHTRKQTHAPTRTRIRTHTHTHVHTHTHTHTAHIHTHTHTLTLTLAHTHTHTRGHTKGGAFLGWGLGGGKPTPGNGEM